MKHTLMPPTTSVTQTGDEFVLNGCYHIPFHLCDSEEKLRACLAELDGKPWCNAGLIFAFVAAATKRLDNEHVQSS
jgi:hypothetical protein